MTALIRFPRGLPKTLREWEQIFRPINEIISESPDGSVNVEADNLPSQDAPYVTSGSTTGLPAARQLAGMTGQTVVTDNGTTVEVSLAERGTPGTYTKVVTDSKGRVVSGATLQMTDMPATLQIIHSGFGDPNGVLSAPPGSIYLNKAGGSGTTLWVKETGSSNTGWDGK